MLQIIFIHPVQEFGSIHLCAQQPTVDMDLNGGCNLLVDDDLWFQPFPLGIHVMYGIFTYMNGWIFWW